MIAENQFVLTRSLFQEGMVCVSGYRKTVRNTLLFLGVLWLALAALTLRQQPGFAVIEGIVLILVALWIALWLPRSKAKRAFQSLENKYGGEMTRSVRFLPEALEIEVGGAVNQIPYEQIVSTAETRRLIVLICRDKKGIMLKKDAFTQGSWEAAAALLDKKEETHD